MAENKDGDAVVAILILGFLLFALFGPLFLGGLFALFIAGVAFSIITGVVYAIGKLIDWIREKKT